MPHRITVAPPVEPIGLQEAKDHLEIDAGETSYDAMVDALIKHAREQAETFTGRQLITATLEHYRDAFPGWPEQGVLTLPRAPLISVTSIKYIDLAGVLQTLDSGKYKVDTVSEPGRVVPAYGESWPATRGEINAVVVEFKAGYGLAGGLVPRPIIQAMLLTIGTLFVHREDVVTGTIVAELPDSAKMLLWPYRVWC